MNRPLDSALATGDLNAIADHLAEKGIDAETVQVVRLATLSLQARQAIFLASIWDRGEACVDEERERFALTANAAAHLLRRRYPAVRRIARKIFAAREEWLQTKPSAPNKLQPDD